MSTQPMGSKQADLIRHEMAPIVSYIDNENARRRVASVVPKGVSVDRLIRMALLAISRNEKLRKCTPESLLLSVCDSAALGLDCGGSLGQAYLVPFKNTATLIIGYKGLVALARRSGEVSTIYAHVVRQGDEFSYQLGLEPKLIHTPRADVNAPLTHAYAVCRFKDGGYQCEVMSRAEIERHRARSMAANDGPWVTDYDEMARKTPLRRLAKLLPLTAEAVEAISKSDDAEYGAFGQTIAENSNRPSASDALRDTAAKLAPGETLDAKTGEVVDPADAFEDARAKGCEA